MITIRKSADRGQSKQGWLKSFHTFSFAQYYDPHFMGWKNLRVINEDTVQPGYGFSTHAHQNMEIISYVVEGELAHKDSLGNGSIIKPGEIQRMSAGTGIEHSEFNPSKEKPLHFLQIWIMPEKADLVPSYEQKKIIKLENQWILIGSRDEKKEAIQIHQDVELFVSYLTTNHVVDYYFQEDRSAWLQVIKGEINLNNHILKAGDGAAIYHEEMILIKCIKEAELLLFDLNEPRLETLR